MGKSLLNPLGAKKGTPLSMLTDVKAGTKLGAQAANPMKMLKEQTSFGTPKTQPQVTAGQGLDYSNGGAQQWTPPGQMYQGAPAGPKTPDTSAVMSQATAGMPPQMQSFFQQQQAARQQPQGGKGSSAPAPYGGSNTAGPQPPQSGLTQDRLGQIAGRLGGGKSTGAPGGGGKNSSAPPPPGGAAPGMSKSGKGTTAPNQYAQQQQGTANAYAQALRGGGGGSLGGTAQY